MSAVCKNLTFDYTYTALVGEFTQTTYAGITIVLVITGTDFPVLSADIQKVWYAMTECTIDQAKFTQMNTGYTLTKDSICGGDYNPK